MKTSIEERKAARRADRRSDIGWMTFIVVGWVLLLAPGNIDGSLFPVSKPLQITAVEEFPDDRAWTVIDGTSQKLRTCSFRRVDWFLGTREKPNVPVPVALGEPEIRSIGGMVFEDWRVKISPPERVLQESFADVFHQCSIVGIELPWLTKTRFWN